MQVAINNFVLLLKTFYDKIFAHIINMLYLCNRFRPYYYLEKYN